MDLVKAVKDLVDRCEQATASLKVAEARLKIRARVCVGDVWMYVINWAPPRRANKKRGTKAHKGYDAVDVVASINRSKDTVTFVDGGWSTLENMETDPNWILLGRAYMPGDEKPFGQAARKEGSAWRT